MTAALEKVVPMLAELSADDRDELREILDGLEIDEGSETGDPEMDRILQERYEAVMNGTAKGRPGPEVFAELQKRFP